MGAAARARPPSAPAARKRWLVFSDDGVLGSQVTSGAGARGRQRAGRRWPVTAVRRAGRSGSYTIRPDETRATTSGCSKSCGPTAGAPEYILHLWTAPHAVDAEHDAAATSRRHQSAGFYSLICLAQGLEKTNVTELPFRSASSRRRAARVVRRRPSVPREEHAAGRLQGAAAGVSRISAARPSISATGVRTEAAAAEQDRRGARRRAGRPRRGLSRRAAVGSGVSSLRHSAALAATVRPGSAQGGVYLITGGLGNIGLEFAEALAERVQAKLVLIGRSEFPERAYVGTAADQSARRRGESKDPPAAEDGGARLGGPGAARGLWRTVGRWQLRSLEAYDRFGVVHGVIHGAGNTTRRRLHRREAHRPRARRAAFPAEGAGAVRVGGTVPRS